MPRSLCLLGKYVVKMRAALKKGWPLEALIDILRKQWIEIQPNTLRSYIQRQKKKVEEQAVFAEAANGRHTRRHSKGKQKIQKTKKGNLYYSLGDAFLNFIDFKIPSPIISVVSFGFVIKIVISIGKLSIKNKYLLPSIFNSEFIICICFT